MLKRLEKRYQQDKRFNTLAQTVTWVIIGALTLAVGAFFISTMRSVDEVNPDILAVRRALASITTDIPVAIAEHVTLPEEVRGIYMTSYSAASSKIRKRLIDYAQRNGINSVVVDVKDGNGRLSFIPNRPSLQPFAPEKATIADLDSVLKELKEAGLYRIARVFVFQDPYYVGIRPGEAIGHVNGGVWRDYKGIPWVDPTSRTAWKYNVEIAKEIYGRGFDEIQFDYIRFPSDGNMSTVKYQHFDPETQRRRDVIGNFFKFMYRELEVNSGIPISYDLFGFAMWGQFDLGIGQMLEDALPYSTAISAMVYPSHYPPGTLGLSNPAAYPYEIVADSMQRGNELYGKRDQDCALGVEDPIMPCDASLAHHRPWIQAFDIGAVYTADKYWDQIRAVRENGGKGWLLWNARNVYRDFNVK